MCTGNRARSSINFINKQYQALYTNAKLCTEEHGTGYKPKKSEIEYGTCLYDFYGQVRRGALSVNGASSNSKDDLECWFSFAEAPKLDFICNHEVIFYLNVKEGAYVTDVFKSGFKVYVIMEILV